MSGVRIALTAAIGGMLIVPASPLADEPPAPPAAVLDGPSTAVPAGKPVELDSSRSTPGSGAIVGHIWDLDGNGSFETDTGAQPTAQTKPRTAGPLTVQVRVLDDHGQSADAKLDLTVSPPAPPAEASIASGPGINLGAPATPARPSTAPALVPAQRLHDSTATKKRRAKAHKTAAVTAAAASGVTIKNFRFSPGTSSVHVGDTITWTNHDVAPHTATARDGSFNTGTINKGKSGSHTFTKAGSFPYICSIHPSMKGNVTVLGSSGGSGSNPSGGTPGGRGTGSSSSSSTPSASSSSSLPHTGLDIAVIVLIALCMTGSGASLRRALR